MQHYGTILGIATRHKCRHSLIYGLQTNQYLQEHAKCIEIIEQVNNWSVYINHRLQVAAGKAIAKHHVYGTHIQLHPALIDPMDYVARDFKNTFFHEVAHLLAWRCSGIMKHDFIWAYCMKQFGYEPSRCYNGHLFDYRNYHKRAVRRIVDEIAADLPDFDLQAAAKEDK